LLRRRHDGASTSIPSTTSGGALSSVLWAELRLDIEENRRYDAFERVRANDYPSSRVWRFFAVEDFVIVCSVGSLLGRVRFGPHLGLAVNAVG
jgi:hypothetical protein